MGKSDQLQDFLRFGFADDARFKEWRSKIEVTDSVSEQRLQAKWYKKNIDVNFDLAWLSDGPSAATSKPAGAGTSTSSSSTAAAGAGGHASRFTASHFASAPSSRQPEQASGSSSQQQQQPQSNGRPAPASAGGTGASSSRNSTLTEVYLFAYHLALLVLGVLYLVPVVPSLWKRSYSMFMQLATVGQGYKVFVKYGVPQGIWPFSWPLIQNWLAQVAPTSELHFLLVSVAFSRQPSPFFVIPVVIPALYAALAFGTAKLGGSSAWSATGGRLEGLLLGKRREALQVAAFSEIIAAFALIVGLFGPSRNFINVMLYWNLIKMRYHVSDQAVQHKAAWHAIGQRVLPLRVRFRLLDTAINYVSSWFLSVPR